MKPVKAVLAAATILMSASLAAPAAAQTGYPPPPCAITFSTQVLGSLQVGSTVTFFLSPLCDWAPGAQVAVTVNGVFVGNKVPGPNGAVSVLVEALSPTLLSIDDPVLVPAQCGPNSIRGVGASVAAQAGVTHEGTFQLLCTAAAPPQPQRPRGPLAFTGGNLAMLAALGALLLAVGLALASASRRRRRSPTPTSHVG